MSTSDPKTPTRRDVLKSGAALGGAALAGGALLAHSRAAAAAPPAVGHPTGTPSRVPAGAAAHSSIATPNNSVLPWKTMGGVKVFHLVANAFEHEFAPGLRTHCWGFNGNTPGPTIEVTEGDHCRFYVTNRLPGPTTVHWHGVFLPNGMDGVGGLTQKPIMPGQTFRYEFPFTRPGTFMYHPHQSEMTEIALGMVGMIVVHPRHRPRGRPVWDYALMLQEWKVRAGQRRPDPLAMSDFNVLTINGKAFPATEPVVAERGDLLRLRLGNLGPMEHHPIHLHGHAFRVVETDGGQVSPSAQRLETTVLVPVGSVRVVELVAERPGDWALHCHMTHHMMNQMGHDAANLVGVDLAGVDPEIQKVVPGYMSMGPGRTMAGMKMPVPANSIPMKGGAGPFAPIDMGGMFTIVKIRERLAGTGDPGWYQHPAGTVAGPATPAELARDGIEG